MSTNNESISSIIRDRVYRLRMKRMMKMNDIDVLDLGGF